MNGANGFVEWTCGLACTSQQEFHTKLLDECEHRPDPSRSYTISAALGQILRPQHLDSGHLTTASRQSYSLLKLKNNRQCSYSVFGGLGMYMTLKSNVRQNKKEKHLVMIHVKTMPPTLITLITA